MIYLFSCDGTGNDGIRDRIDSGKIKEYVCDTFDYFDRSAQALLTKVKPGDFIILDTIGALMETTRADIKLGKADSLYWEKVDNLMAGEVYGVTYKAARILIMRRLKNLKNRGARIITIAHEREQRDESGLGRESSHQRAPDVAPQMYSDLLGSSSDIVRLSVLHKDIKDKDGKVRVPAGKRQLQLRATDEAIAKYQVLRERSDSIPTHIIEPTWQKLVATLGKVPAWLTIYGLPGCGKTTLATDMVNFQNQSTDNKEESK